MTEMLATESFLASMLWDFARPLQVPHPTPAGGDVVLALLGMSRA